MVNKTKENENTFTFRENIKLILRGFKLVSGAHKPVLLSKMLFNIVNASVPFISIYFSAQIINELAGNRNLERLILLVAITLGLNLIGAVLKSCLQRWTNYCMEAFWQYTGKVFADKFFSMDYLDVENPKVQQQYAEVKNHQRGMGFGMLNLVQNTDALFRGTTQVLLSIAMAFSLFTLDVPQGSPLAFLNSPISIVFVILLLCCTIFVAPLLFAKGGKIWAEASSTNNQYNKLFNFYFFQMVEGNSAMKDMRMYDQIRLIDNVISSSDNVKTYQGVCGYDAKYRAGGTAISFLSNGMVYLFVALKALGGAFGVGSIVQYGGAIIEFSNGFSSILSSAGSLWNNNPFLDKLFQFLDLPNTQQLGSHPVETKANDNSVYNIEFNNVSFKYPESDKYALKNVNYSFELGERIAVVGMNGSGKTTMIKLLTRLYDVTEGEITLNGVDIRNYDYDQYMEIFGVVFQDFKLMSLTLGENISSSVRYHEKNVSKALELSGFSERLESMPNGLKTYIDKKFDEAGVEVSGGEGQKIALSRALYKDTPIIVLDEPTAALDPIAEFEIYSRFNDIVGEKAVIYISHRLSSCRFCSKIAVFHEGMLVQQGSHESLLADETGRYYKLWSAQAQYYDESVPTEEAIA